MRVVTGAISHETSTFTPVPTTWENFRGRFGYHKGPEILQLFRATNTPTGGFIAGAEQLGFELLPTIFANAHPSGTVPRALMDELLADLLAGIEAARPFDGVLLELHGAMVAEGIPDAEGYILTAVRDAVGPHIPIVAQLDIHSNISQTMVEMADVLIGRESYPETDMAERGLECAQVLARILAGEIRPTLAVCRLPMMWGMNQVTAHPPMSEAIERLHQIERLPGVICASIATCFPLADVPDMGASVYIATDADLEQAQQLADGLGAWLFERRADWHLPMPSTRDALASLGISGGGDDPPDAAIFPVVLADRHDNTGGGSPGDSTGMLQTFLDLGLEDACVLYIVDPEAVAHCAAAGVGATLDLAVGGKSSPLQGQPVQMTAQVIALSDGRFQYAGPMFAGLQGNMGPSAHIAGGGVHVLLVSEREQPFDTAFAETLGLDPRQMRYIGVKSAAHFRAGFESWAGTIIVVSEPSVHSPASDPLHFQNLGRALYPLHDI